MTTAAVHLWGRRIGAVSLAKGERTAAFEYDPGFLGSGIDVSPITMPLAGGTFSFPGLAQDSFKGLPGLLSDSLPDRYGEALIDAWLARQGREPGSFDAVERLCYVGRRGMGALEFHPARGPRPTANETIDLEALVELAAEVLSKRSDLEVSLRGARREAALRQILRVGTSAGGARPKALVALDPRTKEVRSGQLDVDPGFEHWILKFDGVEDGSRDFGTALGYGAVEYAYSRMAGACGVEMSKCELLADGERRHFMTRRFDRTEDGARIHMQSLAAISHLDYRLPEANSYEQAFLAIRQLRLPRSAVEQQFRRMVFNVVARNQDDHVKNIAFLMDRGGSWSLSPAFDVTYAYNPAGTWTSRHQMSIAGMRDGFTVEDLLAVADVAAMKRTQGRSILAEVTEAVRNWPALAAEAGVSSAQTEAIGANHRLALPPG